MSNNDLVQRLTYAAKLADTWLRRDEADLLREAAEGLRATLAVQGEAVALLDEIRAFCATASHTQDSACSLLTRAAAAIAHPAPVSAGEAVAIHRERVQSALEAVQNAMQDAYQNAYQVCCGRGVGGECCGEAEPEWDKADERIMGVLAPVQRELSELLAAHPAAPSEPVSAPCRS